MLNVVSFLKNALPFIIFGIALGAIVGYSFNFRMELCISLGMVVGESGGSLIVKKKWDIKELKEY